MGKDPQIRSITEKDRNINWFGKGDQRKLVMMQFYAELESMGINYDIGIKNNLHVDDFEFVFYKRLDIELPVKVHRIMSRYEKTINQTCTSCGKTSYRSGSSYFCAKCIFKSEKARRYEKISDLGFATFSDRNSNKSRRQFFYWNEFSGVEFIFEDDLRFRHFPNQVKLCFKPGKVETEEVDWLYITDWYENYFNVLKHIPDHLLSEANRLNKKDLIENLNYCVICGYKAVYSQKGCLVCNCVPTKELTDRQKKRYSSVEQFNKRQQLEYYQECQYRYKYPKHESAFEKSDTHKILITKDELKNYRYRK